MRLLVNNILPKYDSVFLSSRFFFVSWLTLDKLETTPLRVVVSYVYLVFSQPPACLHQAM